MYVTDAARFMVLCGTPSPVAAIAMMPAQSRVLSYMRQLAIITPYAEFNLRYSFRGQTRRNFEVTYSRRATKMPPLATEVRKPRGRDRRDSVSRSRMGRHRASAVTAGEAPPEVREQPACQATA